MAGSGQLTADQRRGVYERLLDLARAQGDALANGSLERFALLMAEREKLGKKLPSTPATDEEEKRLIKELLRLDVDTAACLSEQMAVTMEQSRSLTYGMQTQNAYRRALLPAGNPPRILDSRE